MTVYFAQVGPELWHPVKIGSSGNVPKRIRALSWHLQDEINLIGVVDGSFEEERAFHTRFARHRFGMGREQFWPRGEFLEFLLALPPPPQWMVEAITRKIGVRSAVDLMPEVPPR